jgi:uncharacterized membrane protein
MAISRSKLADNTFIIGVVFKGVGGFIELATGLLLLAIPATTLIHWAAPLSHIDLLPPITAGVKGFVAVYFSLRGLLRMALAVCLLQERLWAYPVTLLFLGASILYQAWLLTHRHYSGGLLGLTLFDVAIVALTIYEYRKLRHGGHLAGSLGRHPQPLHH